MRLNRPEALNGLDVPLLRALYDAIMRCHGEPRARARAAQRRGQELLRRRRRQDVRLEGRGAARLPARGDGLAAARLRADALNAPGRHARAGLRGGRRRLRPRVRVGHRHRRRVRPSSCRRDPRRHGAGRGLLGDALADRRPPQGDGDRADQPDDHGAPRHSRWAWSRGSSPDDVAARRGPASSPASSLPARRSPSAATKRLLWDGLGRSVEECLPDESRTVSELSGTADSREGLAAVIERREPRFQGR